MDGRAREATFFTRAQSAWYVKCRALTAKAYIDDIEVEEEALGDALMEENAVAKVPRPGTSLARPGTQSTSGRPGTSSQSSRPMTNSGRPITGFARPGTQSARPGTNSGRPGTQVRPDRCATRPPCTAPASQTHPLLLLPQSAFRPGTMAGRPVTSSGRFVRLMTASMVAEQGGPFLNVERLDLRKYAARPTLARALCDYLVYNDHNMAKAMELCAHATVQQGFEDWWWKARLGKCYYQLGLLRDAEKQFTSSLRDAPVVSTALELGKVFTRMDQPQRALVLFRSSLERHPGDPSLLLGIARIEDQLGNTEAAMDAYRRVLDMDSSNVEALASLAAQAFYEDQPESALRHYRRLLQMGVQGAEVWNNVGLSCFYAGQYDLCLK